jgi:GSCFA family
MNGIVERCPYKGLPNSNYWSKSVALQNPELVDPVTRAKFLITKSDRVATAGSCFAQHIARYLSKSGFNYYVPEAGHSILRPETKRLFNYGTFSARYGNIYTTRQLLQLLQRAYGIFSPEDTFWQSNERYYDPYRPFIQPDGFSSLTDLVVDRETHLRAVRTMVETMDVFVFTLGLTETWESMVDGAVYPVCPGCGAGTFDSQRYRFLNMRMGDVASDLRKSIEIMRTRNPGLRIMLTVSPVPLIATFEQSHVLQATTYSKAVLRVAANEIAAEDENIDYFPSYEIITGSFNRGAYYESDLREVKEAGVEHVMSVFMRHYLKDSDKSPIDMESGREADVDDRAGRSVAEIVCDEENLLK